MPRKWGENGSLTCGFMNRIEALLGQSGGQLCRFKTWKLLGPEEMRRKRESKYMLRPNKVPCRIRDALGIPDSLSSCLCALANRRVISGDAGQDIIKERGLKLSAGHKTCKGEGKEREQARKRKSTKLKYRIISLLSKPGFFFFNWKWETPRWNWACEIFAF